MTDDDYDALSQKKLASIKRDMRESLENAAIRATHKVMAEFEAKSDERLMEPPPEFIDALKYDVARRDSEFFTHNVEQPYDWSEWVCPDPKGYLMKCCDCGLVHEAEFGVVRYKSETEREDCDRVDDPNLQAVFRMRRSEQWSSKDTAHRTGGMPMAQPEQGSVAWEQFHEHLVERNFCPRCGKRTADPTTIHTCTPPIAADPKAFHGFPSGSVSTPNAGGKCVTAGETAPVRQIDPNALAFDRGLEST